MYNFDAIRNVWRHFILNANFVLTIYNCTFEIHWYSEFLMNFRNASIHKMFDTDIYAMSDVIYRIISNLHFVTLSS